MLPEWRSRVLVFRVLGALPRSERIVDVLRMRLGNLRGVDLDGKLGGLREMVLLLQRAGQTVEGRDLVEIGTGWHPLVPIVFFGLGARTILLTDIARHLRRELAEDVLEYCLGHAREIAGIVGGDESSLVARWASLRPVDCDWLTVWQDHGISYRAPCDIVGSALPAESADLVFSNDCLGYVPVQALIGLTRESLRILRPGGVIAHDVTVYDDRTIQDRSVPPWGFLSYGNDEWQRIGNSRLHFQNRLRPAEYRQLVAQLGFRMLYAERVPLEADQAIGLDQSSLHADYRDLPEEEILCRHFLFAAQKPSAAEELQPDRV
jgi:SAM-dependent methyltransferase